MICFRNTRVIDSNCEDCKNDAYIFNEWRENGGQMPEFTCLKDHRLVCGDCGEASDELKFCRGCKAKL